MIVAEIRLIMHSPSFGFTDAARMAAYACLRDLRRFGGSPLLWVMWTDRNGWVIASGCGCATCANILHSLVELWKAGRHYGFEQWARDLVGLN